MDAIPHLPRPPLRHRMPAPVRTALVWVAVGLFPFVLLLSVATGTSHGDVNLGFLRIPQALLVPIVAMALPAVLLRRRPLLALALTVLGAAVQIVAIHPWVFGYLSGIRLVQILAMDLAVSLVAATRSRRVSVAVAAVTLCVRSRSASSTPPACASTRNPSCPRSP